MNQIGAKKKKIFSEKGFSILNIFTLKPGDDSEDTDETDYFDSEDEYWESVRKKRFEDVFCLKCRRHHPKHSRHGDECKLNQTRLFSDL